MVKRRRHRWGRSGPYNAEGVAIPAASSYLVYFRELGPSPMLYPQEEIKWLSVLDQRIPGTDLVTDVFPYSVTMPALPTKMPLHGCGAK